MDRKYPSNYPSSPSLFSPRSRSSISNSTTRLLKQSPSLNRKSSRYSVSGKSTASQALIILKSPFNCIERYGQPLPVLITEALTFADRSVAVSTRISASGYAWIVCGRRLLIWQYRQRHVVSATTPNRKQVLTNQCFELQLPQSDLAHRAELISVFLSKNPANNTPSCIAVSPEGVVRYWPAVAHENVSVEQTVDLHGQECDSLTEVEGLGCILATTTCTIVLIQPQFQSGRNTFTCRLLKSPSGWLGGIGKRVSSLIFGPMSSEQSAETRVVRIKSISNNDGTHAIYVLAGHSLQKWIIPTQENQQEQLLYSTDINRLIRDTFQQYVWDNCGLSEQLELENWSLDIQLDGADLVVLAAAVNLNQSRQVRYAFISFHGRNTAPTQIKNFVALRIPRIYREENPSDALAYRFLLTGNTYYVYNDRSIVVLRQNEEPDFLELNASQDILLGGSICINTPIFFCRHNGLVAVTSNEFSGSDLANVVSMSAAQRLEMSFSDTMAGSNLSVFTMDPEEIQGSFKDTVGQVKAAFIFSLKHQHNSCNDILNELFPQESVTIGVNNKLDLALLNMCADLLDDVPAVDPRWTNNASAGIGSSYSMQVLHQLEMKHEAFGLFLKFLKDFGLWKRLTSCKIRNSVMTTVHIIGEYAEKITAAVLLKNVPNCMILEDAIEKAIGAYETVPSNGLTNQDVFYREVSKIYKGMQEMISCCDEVAHSDRNPTEIAHNINETNEILLNILQGILKYRQMNLENFTPSDAAKSLASDYLPWTAAGGVDGLADSLLVQHTLTHTYGFKITGEGHLRNSLLDQFVILTDILLDGRKSHLESVRGTSREAILYKQFVSDRHKLIKPLLQVKEWEKGALLSEKYLDFESLVLICELTDNQKHLDEYIERFGDDGFADYVYNWYLKENKQGKLIERYRNTSGRSRKNAQDLTNFLAEHANLSWMQHVFDKNFSTAARVLSQLGEKEAESVTRQKTIFSLAKLAQIASPNSVESEVKTDEINQHLELITFQEELPDYVLQQFGYDTIRPPAISAKDLIHLYTCAEFADAAELEFKKALDILRYVDDIEMREELALQIWRSAILRDNWNHKNLDSPMDILENTLFFKLIDMCLMLGADPYNILPPLESLTDDSTMEHFQDNKSFQFLIKTCYEHVNRTQMA